MNDVCSSSFFLFAALAAHDLLQRASVVSPTKRRTNGRSKSFLVMSESSVNPQWRGAMRFKKRHDNQDFDHSFDMKIVTSTCLSAHNMETMAQLFC